MVRKRALICAAAAALLALVGGAYLAFRPKPQAAAERFLRLLAAGNYSEAYEETGLEFRAATPLDLFSEMAKFRRLDLLDRAVWKDTHSVRRRALLTGKIVSRSGAAIPIAMQLERAADGWTVQGVGFHGALPEGFGWDESPAPALPASEVQAQMARAAFAALAGGLDSFYQSAAIDWKWRMGAEEFKRAFAPWEDRKDILNRLAAAELPVESSPGDRGQTLTLRGAAPGIPMPDTEIAFELVYVAEPGEGRFGWKISGLNLIGQKIALPPPPQPTDDEARALAKESLSALALAAKSADFSPFQESLAAAWRARSTPDTLKEQFAPYSRAGVDWEAVAVSAALEAPPTIDPERRLLMNGSAPQAIDSYADLAFTMSFAHEEGRWRLAELGFASRGNPSSKPQLPSIKESEALVRDALALLAKGCAEGGFSALHASLSEGVRGSLPLADFAEPFESWLERKPDPAKLKRAKIGFDPSPALEPNNLLFLQGRASAEGKNGVTAEFSLHYRNEKGKWIPVAVRIVPSQ